jgi:catechol 2,3-dioxygenase-like lactoylglutathione lyase family enzyme
MNLLHFGFKVKDIARTSAIYADLFGIVWDPIREYDVPVVVDGQARRNRSYVTHGKTSDGIEIEMVQPIEGEVPDDIALGDREGISHVAFAVQSLEQEKVRLLARGSSSSFNFMRRSSHDACHATRQRSYGTGSGLGAAPRIFRAVHAGLREIRG